MKNIFICLLTLPLLSSIAIYNSFLDVNTNSIYFYFVFVTTGILIFSTYYVYKSFFFININSLDIILICYHSYITFSNFYHNQSNPINQDFIISLYLLVLYFIYKILLIYQRRVIIYAVLSICFIQILLGLGQLFYIIPNTSSEFLIGGSFGNPGVYAAYVSSMIPFILSLCYAIKANKSDSGYYSFSIIVLAASCLIIPNTEARASWLGVSAGIVFIVLIKEPIIRTRLKIYSKKLPIKTAFIILSLFSILALYYYKKDSVSGRLFIWKIGTEMIGENPVFGNGFKSFKLDYNNFQAVYFQSHPSEKLYSQLAGNISVAFNEYLEIAIELGAIGLILIVGIFFISISQFKQYILERDSPIILGAIASILCLGVISLFSYPLHILPIQINFYFFLSIISSHMIRGITVDFNQTSRAVVLSVILVLTVSIGIHQGVRFDAYRTFKNSVIHSINGEYEVSLKMFKKIEPFLQSDPQYLFYYGNALYNSNRKYESILIYEKAKNFSSDPHLYLQLGNNYLSIKKTHQAELAYMQAINIVPNRIIPRFHLFKLYLNTKQVRKAKEIGKTIEEMKIKVPSEMINEIREIVKADLRKLKFK